MTLLRCHSTTTSIVIDTLHLSAQGGAIGGDSRFSREPSPIPEGTARPFVLDIDRSVMISMSNKPTSNTALLSHRQRLAYPVATLRTVLRRELRRNLQHLAASVCSFARKDQKEGEPRHVRNRLCQMMILQHPGNAERLNRNHIILSNDLECGLVMEVGSFALHVLMMAREQLSSLAAAFRAFLAAAQSALRSLQLRFGLSEDARVVNLFARAHRGEGFDAHINADRLASLGDEARLILFDGKDNVPPVGLALDGASLNCSCNLAGEANTTTANLGEMQFVAFKSEARLRIGERIVAMFALKARIAGRLAFRAATEESVERLAHAAQYVLKDLAVNIADIRAHGFDVRKLRSLIVIVKRDVVNGIGVAPLLKAGIV